MFETVCSDMKKEKKLFSLVSCWFPLTVPVQGIIPVKV